MVMFEEVVAYLILALIGILTFFGWRFARKHPEAAMKFICMAAVVAMGLCAFAFAGAEGEVNEIKTVDFRRVELALFNGEAVLRIWFDYHGELLSWYDDVFLPYVEYNITIFAGEEVIDAEPAVDAVSH